LLYKTLQNKLPVTFRVNPSLVNYERLVGIFSDPEFVKKYWKETDDDQAKDQKADESKEKADETNVKDESGIQMGQEQHMYKKDI
jgi:hypothetical protein